MKYLTCKKTGLYVKSIEVTCRWGLKIYHTDNKDIAVCSEEDGKARIALKLLANSLDPETQYEWVD